MVAEGSGGLTSKSSSRALYASSHARVVNAMATRSTCTNEKARSSHWMATLVRQLAGCAASGVDKIQRHQAESPTGYVAHALQKCRSSLVTSAEARRCSPPPTRRASRRRSRSSFQLFLLRNKTGGECRAVQCVYLNMQTEEKGEYVPHETATFHDVCSRSPRRSHWPRAAGATAERP